MSKLVIKSNYQWRQFKYRYEVPRKILENQFDWMIPKELTPDQRELWFTGEIFPELTGGQDYMDGFFQYKSSWYSMSDFMNLGDNCSPEFQGWHGYHNDSFFSGILIKISGDGEEYQVGRYCS